MRFLVIVVAASDEPWASRPSASSRRRKRRPPAASTAPNAARRVASPIDMPLPAVRSRSARSAQAKSRTAANSGRRSARLPRASAIAQMPPRAAQHAGQPAAPDRRARRGNAGQGSPPAAQRHSGLRQARRHGPLAHRRDRHHRRPGLRLRAFQAIRLPARQGGRADLRRRPVAGEHAGRAQGAGRQLPESHVLRDRRARDVASRRSPSR